MRRCHLLVALLAWVFLNPPVSLWAVPHTPPNGFLAHSAEGNADEKRCAIQTNDLFWRATFTGVGLAALWGITQWDYFSSSPSTSSEGWFAKSTSNGGADKLGHMYSSYVLSHGLQLFYEHKGMTDKEAIRNGALSSLAIMSFIELGDAFSSHGFSPEDLLANGVGALLGYVLGFKPALSSKIDFRYGFDLSPNKVDFFTDYENARYLLAVKLNGFEIPKKTLWRHLELHLGYYTRGFDGGGNDRRRKMYLGVGINLTDLLYRRSWKKTATFLRYVQLPLTSFNTEHEVE